MFVSCETVPLNAMFVMDATCLDEFYSSHDFCVPVWSCHLNLYTHGSPECQLWPSPNTSLLFSSSFSFEEYFREFFVPMQNWAFFLSKVGQLGVIPKREQERQLLSCQ